jgi:hypothetical protein
VRTSIRLINSRRRSRRARAMPKLMRENSTSFSMVATEVATSRLGMAVVGKRSSIESRTPSERTRIASTSIRGAAVEMARGAARAASFRSQRDPERSPGPRDTVADDECFTSLN